MNDQENSLLIVSCEKVLSNVQREKMRKELDRIYDATGLKSVFFDGGIKGEVSRDFSSLVDAIQYQSDAIASLVASNQEVIALLTDVVSSMADEMDGDESEIPSVYLDGSPCQ